MEASSVRAPLTGAFVPRGPSLLRLRSDEQLVAQFRAGNDDAFSVLHDRYRQRLFAYVRQMLPPGPRSDAEDVLQDVFARAYVALRADERPMAARAWLYRVAHNRCVDSLRRPAPQPAELPDVAASDLHDPMVEASRREDLALLVSDLGRLPEQQRSALLMRELEGLSYNDLAGALDCTLPAVKSLLVRARMGLAEAAVARDTACADIRADLADSCEAGRRASATARRHMSDCAGCRGYREALRGTSRGLNALNPSHGPIAAIAKLLGLGGSGAGGLLGGGGAAAGGGIIGGGTAGGGLVGGTGAAGIAAGGGAVAATATKVAVVVCCIGAAAGGARDAERSNPVKTPTRAAAVAAAAQAALPVPAAQHRLEPTPAIVAAPVAEPAPAEPDPVVSEPIVTTEIAAETVATDASGGALAPDDTAEEETAAIGDGAATGSEGSGAALEPAGVEPSAETPAQAMTPTGATTTTTGTTTPAPAKATPAVASTPAETGGATAP